MHGLSLKKLLMLRLQMLKYHLTGITKVTQVLEYFQKRYIKSCLTTNLSKLIKVELKFILTHQAANLDIARFT